jgi:CheY-like chemotaxis protein
LLRVALFQWDGREAAERVVRLAAEGIEAVYRQRTRIRFGEVRASAPDAAVIDLTHMPSWGRAVGAMFREQKSLRSIPLVFIEGDPEKTDLVRQMLPDAVFTTWPRVAAGIRRAMRQARPEPEFRKPPGKSVAGKLRIREGATVALLHAPPGVERILGPLPEGARLQKRADGAQVILLFVKTMASLGAQLGPLAGRMETGRTCWVIWPKKRSGAGSGLSMPAIREAAFSLGLVDHKVCALDDTWSGMAIARRRGLSSEAMR